jgi:hypothetical protein
MRALILVAVCLSVLAGCRKGDTERPSAPSVPRAALTPPPPAPRSADIEVEEPDSAATAHAKGSLKPYSVSRGLAEVSNLAAFEKVFPLTPNQRALLASRLFAATETQYEQLFWLYENNEYHNVPSFVTTDVVLHLYHCFFDYALRTVESESLLPVLTELTSAMLAASIEDVRAVRDESARSAAIRNAAYFGVAARLIGLKGAVPGPAEPMVRKELAAIGERAGFSMGAIFPYKLDYSQFQPRGHYTRSPKLRRFFMAMMWYGLTPFATRTGDGRPAPGPVLQGLMMARNLRERGLLHDWGVIYEPTTFFVGKADDHIAAQWLSVADTIFGRADGPDGIAAPAKLERFIEGVEKLPGAAIRAEMTLEKQVPSPKHQLRFMGQRFIPDSEVLQRLSRSVERPFPSGLDVMAVLGSQRAARLLDGHLDVYNPRNWPEYRAERVKLRKEFAGMPAARWTSNLYWGWLDGLRALMAPIPEGFPSFMMNENWQDKSLGTALGSWAELRHDTILYGKQSAVECGDGEERPTPTGYVEPNVPFYERMLALTRKSREGLESRALLPTELKSSFEEFEGLLDFLRKCAVKELAGKLLTEEENREIQYIGGKIEFLTRATMEGRPQYWDLVDKGDRDMAVIADVHTAPPSVLEVGVGRASEILVIVPIGKKLVLTRGAILTYHEFQHPIGDRLTDEKWREMLKAGKAPEPPFWTRSFLLPRAGDTKNRDQKQSYSSGC